MYRVSRFKLYNIDILYTSAFFFFFHYYYFLTIVYVTTSFNFAPRSRESRLRYRTPPSDDDDDGNNINIIIYEFLSNVSAICKHNVHHLYLQHPREFHTRYNIFLFCRLCFIQGVRNQITFETYTPKYIVNIFIAYIKKKNNIIIDF